MLLITWAIGLAGLLLGIVMVLFSVMHSHSALEACFGALLGFILVVVSGAVLVDLVAGNVG